MRNFGKSGTDDAAAAAAVAAAASDNGGGGGGAGFVFGPTLAAARAGGQQGAKHPVTTAENPRNF